MTKRYREFHFWATNAGHCGRPVTANAVVNAVKVKSRIKEDSLITHEEIQDALGISSRSVYKMPPSRGKKTRQTEERWEDNIRKWTGLEFGKSQRAVENRVKWRKLVAKTSEVPNDPRG